MKGIINIGNSCYLNSALQLLFNSDDFCNITKLQLYDCIKEYKSDQNNFNPSKVKALLDTRTNIFRGSYQQDSSECIIYLLDLVDQAKVVDRFGIKTNINIKCKMLSCLRESEHIENDLMLTLPLTNDLSDSYREYKNYERLENENAYQCDHCQTKTIGRKRIETIKWPDNLIIVLKRFDNNMVKNNNNIMVPLEWRHGYKLRGGIIHMGNFNGGHYIYYGYKSNRWFIANDSNVTPIDMNKLNEITKQSYILYYVK
jgi:ubiquitin C-terminal hydrolase